jgi:hypothetical protein
MGASTVKPPVITRDGLDIHRYICILSFGEGSPLKSTRDSLVYLPASHQFSIGLHALSGEQLVGAMPQGSEAQNPKPYG